MKKLIFPLLVSALLLGFTTSSMALDLAKKCADCHGKDGNSTEGKVPTIAGISAAYFKDTMKMYKTGDRPAMDFKVKGKTQNMKDITNKLSDGDIAKLADFYAKKKFKAADQKFDAAKAKKGKKLHKKYCEKCHENGGRSAEDDAGLLAGQHSEYLKYTFDSFKSKKRTMGKKMAKKFEKMLKTDGDGSIDLLINYYASEK